MDVHRGPAALTRLLDALGEPTRRRCYDEVRASRRPVSRAEAADALDINVRLAAFHLDRLVEAGLLVAHYARPEGRRGGPGAGRPTKWYTPTGEGLEVTVPPRRNDVAARILLQAATDDAADRPAAIRAAARQVGADLARGCRGDRDLQALIVELGYEPASADGGQVDLVNCPFHELVDRDRSTVCHMNHAMLEAAAIEARAACTASLERREGLCCVRLGPAAATPAS
jgi:predicted ArsR family transcriptional regulator